MYLEIEVSPSGPAELEASDLLTLYDFIDQAGEATWSSGDLPYTPLETDISETLPLPGAAGMVAVGPAFAQYGNGGYATGPDKNIVETAVEAGSFTTLVAAVQAAGLVDVLSGEGPFTVFAPTDEAFAKLPEGTIEALLADKEKLTAILTYHVVSGRIYSDQLENGAAAKTLQGNPVKVKLADGNAFINDSRVVSADIETTNGVIHVIDKVLLPQ